VSSPYEFLRRILLLPRLGEERKEIADWRLQIGEGIGHRAKGMEHREIQQTEERKKGFYCGSGFLRSEPVEGQHDITILTISKT
jgi:hypothetical protein